MEKQKIEIKELPLSATIKINIDILHTILTRDEFNILKIVLYEQEALDASVITTKLENEMQKQKDNKIKIPVYRTVKKILERLVENGILTRRENEGSKAKLLFIVSPQMMKNYNDRRREIMDEYLKLKQKYEGREGTKGAQGDITLKYGDKTLEFYNLANLIPHLLSGVFNKVQD